MCMAVPAGGGGNGTQLQISVCDENSINHQFNKDGGKFISRLNGKVIDASGTNTGAPITLWDSHGGANQKWRAGLN